jgi:hypothetical protein
MKKENYEIVHLVFLNECGQRKGMLLSFLYNVVSSGKSNWAQTTIADILSYKAIKTIHRDLKWLQDKGFIAYSKIHRGYLHLTHFELSDKTLNLISDNSKELKNKPSKESKVATKDISNEETKRQIETQILATKDPEKVKEIMRFNNDKFTNNEFKDMADRWNQLNN